QQTRNRLVTFRITGDFDYKSDTQFVLDIRYLFLAQKESDGSTSLRVQYVDQDGTLVGDDGANASIGLNGAFRDHFQSPVKLIDLTVPASVRVLSFKAMHDGGL